ncbi:MAG: RES family NAD+ phosphorylase [Terriglobales bacterium]
MRVWRIVKARHAAAAYSGEGARLVGGRWNRAGHPMVYTSLSLALAAMEFFVHVDPSNAPAPLYSVLAEIPDAIAIERLSTANLPRRWRIPDNEATRKLGADWLLSRRTAALLVPSAAVDGEWNALLNPLHPDFTHIKLAAPRLFRYDAAMFR